MLGVYIMHYPPRAFSRLSRTFVAPYHGEHQAEIACRGHSWRGEGRSHYAGGPCIPTISRAEHEVLPWYQPRPTFVHGSDKYRAVLAADGLHVSQECGGGRDVDWGMPNSAVVRIDHLQGSTRHAEVV